jgi:hypothetical protein
MRDDSVVDVVLLIVWLGALVVTLSGAFRSGVDSSSWERQWEILDATERTRISTAARAGTKLDHPDEAALAAGFMRRDRRRHAYLELPLLSLVVGFMAMSAASLIEGGLVAMVIGVATVGIGLWRYLREKHMDGTPRAASSLDVGR